MTDSTARVDISFRTLCMLILAIVAGIGAALFVTGWKVEVFHVVNSDALTPKIQLWLMLIMAQAVLWVICGFYFAAGLRRLLASTKSPNSRMLSAFVTLLPCAVVLLALAVRSTIVRSPIPPPTLGKYTITNLPWFGATGMLVAAFAVWEMFVVSSILKSEFGDSKNHGTIQRFIELRDTALQLLFVAGVVLALGTLAGSALRNAANFDKGTSFFPQEYVILYGATFTLLLVAVYAPVYAGFYSAGVRLRNGTLGEPPLSSEAFKQWKENRDALNDALGLTFTGTSALGPQLSAFLPLVSGWAASLLEGKK